jgi:ATP:corrinoid adenosyltransferase
MPSPDLSEEHAAVTALVRRTLVAAYVLVLLLGICPATNAQDAAAVYHSKYSLTGFLMRAAVVCDGDGKRTVDAAFGIISTPELRAVTKAYPATVNQWMQEGSASFNEKVMKVGIGSACEDAMAVRRRAEVAK